MRDFPPPAKLRYDSYPERRSIGDERRAKGRSNAGRLAGSNHLSAKPVRNADYNREENSLIESDATAHFYAYAYPARNPNPCSGFLNKPE
jgi:hypothetical protein